MVIRGFPEEARRAPADIPVVEEPPKVEPTAEVRYVYYPPAQRITLDPNIALITMGIVAAVGIIALAIIYKK